MSGQSIKTAVAQLLAERFKDLQVETKYRRFEPGSPLEAAVVWNVGHNERRSAGGRATPPYGLKDVTWRTLVHVLVYGEDYEAGADRLEELVDQVKLLVRDYPDLGGRADTELSKVINFGEELSVDSPSPDTSQSFALYQAVITLTVMEVVNA